MWRYFILSLSLIAGVVSIIPKPIQPYSAASESQIRFAIENSYDNTGPGAKEPEYAYHTYKTLDNALVSYLNDEDTKLPEHERQRAISLLTGNPANLPPRQLPKTVEEYTGYTERPQQSNLFNYGQQVIYDPNTNYKYTDLRGYQPTNIPPKKTLNQVNKDSFFNLQSVQGPTLAPGAGNYDLKSAHDQFDPHPKYSFSYGVHDKNTGDSKSAQEVRDGGSVRGYYTFMDPDGKRRTVHYIADDKKGFRATVHRSE